MIKIQLCTDEEIIYTISRSGKFAYDKKQAIEILRNYLAHGRNQKELVEIVDKTIEVVINKHYFNYPSTLHEDFYSASYEKIYKVLKTYDFKRDIFTFIYTIARNEIHNWIYHNLEKTKNNVSIETIFSGVGDDGLDYVEEEDGTSLYHFMDVCFPPDKFIIGEGLMDFLSLLHNLHAVTELEEDAFIFGNERNVHEFVIYASFYLKSDIFLLLYAYYQTFGTHQDFGAMLIALASLKNKMPNVKVITKIVDSFVVILKNKNEIRAGYVPAELREFKEKLEKNFEDYDLEKVIDCMEGVQLVDQRIFTDGR